MNKQRESPKIHEPVLLKEVLEAAKPKAPLKKQVYAIDATVGTGGHTEGLVKAGFKVLGIEADKEMLELAAKRLANACPALNQGGSGSYKLVLGNFAELDKIAIEAGFERADVIIFDLGVSTLQLTSPTRGFSFRQALAPLDMRLNRKEQAVTGADLLNSLRQDQLSDLFAVVLSPGVAKKLAKIVCQQREIKPMTTVGDFLEVIERVIKTKKRLHPATLPFLALRMAVNSELENLKQALPKAFDLLNPGGRLLVISFHSGEDRIVKHFFRQMVSQNLARNLTKKPILPTEKEIEANPKSRSAKLRVLQKK